MCTEKRLRVLQVHNYYQIPGGEDTVVANEKELLEEHGHIVIQYSRNNNELKKFSKLRKLLLPFTTIFNPKTYKEIKKIINEQQIDIVHVHNTLNLVSPSVYYAALICKVPVIQTVHNFRLLCPGATFYRDGEICEECVEHGPFRAVKYGCYRNSKAQTMICALNTWIHRILGVYGKLNYICLTDFNRRKLLTLKQIKAEKVFVKPNFVVSNFEEVIPYEKRENQFIFVGRIDKLKGVDILLKAWKIMEGKAPRLLICGTGPMEEWCKRYIQENKLSSVTMLGLIPNTEARELIANSKALILPTQWYEGFPMTIVEAYSVGTPVIGSDIGNVSSLIKKKETGYCFSYKNPEKLVEAIKNHSFITEKIKSYYNLNYSAEANYLMLIDCYKRAME